MLAWFSLSTLISIAGHYTTGREGSTPPRPEGRGIRRLEIR